MPSRKRNMLVGKKTSVPSGYVNYYQRNPSEMKKPGLDNLIPPQRSIPAQKPFSYTF